MHAEVHTPIVNNVDSSLPLADVTMQLLQPTTQFGFLFLRTSLRVRPHSGVVLDFTWTGAGVGFGRCESGRRDRASVW